MENIKLHDKEFTLYMSNIEIKDIISKIADEINCSNISAPIFMPILNGSFLFAADLIRKIDICNSEVSFIKVASYEGTHSSGNVKKIIGVNKNIQNRNIIIIEDIIDTGNTINSIVNLLRNENVSSIKIVTLLFKPDVYKKKIKINHIGKSIENKFVVGYGLDYNEIGRNLPHIYKLKE